MIMPSRSTLLPLLTGLLAISIRYITYQVHLMDTKYHQWNNDEWHIDLISSPAYPIRFINAQHYHRYGSANNKNNNHVVLSLLRKFAVTPALDKVLSLMKQADTENIVPKILCNTDAQTNLSHRVQEFYTDIQHSQTLTYTGKIFLYATSYMSLTNHYGLLQLGMKHQVQQQQINEPVFIASLPRTGSTILHRTMSLDTSRFRHFDLADMVVPLPHPIPRWDTDGRKQKVKEANKLFQTIQWIYPGFKECLETMHGFRPSEAEEDLGWYDTGLGHFYMDPLMKLYPEYRQKKLNETIESKEVARYRYAWLSMILKIYQYTDQVTFDERKHTEGRAFLRQHPRPTTKIPWLLKDPNHSAYLPQLLEEFPNAKLIFIHRHPGEVVPSLAKLFVIFTSVDVIPGAVGTSAKEWGEESVKRMEYYSSGLVDFTREQNNNHNSSSNDQSSSSSSSPYSFPSNSTSRIDLSFAQVRWDVPGAIEKIYKQLYPNQPPPSNTAKRAFQAYLEQNEREKHGNQRRSLEDFHLSKDDVAFREYNDMFLGS